jgi:cyclic pyranopterin phosphate synthase
MVDVSQKQITARFAVAQATVILTPAVLKAVQDKATPKGDVFASARIAGIMAAKKTQELIPLCHQIPLNSVTVDFEIQDSTIVITTKASAEAKTGVEMEAMTAAAIAALTLYDMVKGRDKGCTVADIVLIEKSGGKSGSYKRKLT